MSSRDLLKRGKKKMSCSSAPPEFGACPWSSPNAPNPQLSAPCPFSTRLEGRGDIRWEHNQPLYQTPPRSQAQPWCSGSLGFFIRAGWGRPLQGHFSPLQTPADAVPGGKNGFVALSATKSSGLFYCFWVKSTFALFGCQQPRIASFWDFCFSGKSPWLPATPPPPLPARWHRHLRTERVEPFPSELQFWGESVPAAGTNRAGLSSTHLVRGRVARGGPFGSPGLPWVQSVRVLCWVLEVVAPRSKAPGCPQPCRVHGVGARRALAPARTPHPPLAEARAPWPERENPQPPLSSRDIKCRASPEALGSLHFSV